ADYGKYFTGQFLEFARQLEQEGLRVSTKHGILTPADIREFVRRRFLEPGPQSQAPGGSLSTSQNTSLARILENIPGTVAPDSTMSPPAATASPQLTRLPPAPSARVHALLSSQRDPTSPSPTA